MDREEIKEPSVSRRSRERGKDSAQDGLHIAPEPILDTERRRPAARRRGRDWSVALWFLGFALAAAGVIAVLYLRAATPIIVPQAAAPAAPTPAAQGAPAPTSSPAATPTTPRAPPRQSPAVAPPPLPAAKEIAPLPQIHPAPTPKQEAGTANPTLPDTTETITINGTTYIKGREPHSLGILTVPTAPGEGNAN